MDHIWRWVIFLLRLWMLAKVGRSQFKKYELNGCALRMTLTKYVAFQTTVDTKGNEMYNITEYLFDEFVCICEYFCLGSGEGYWCKTGNILDKNSCTSDEDVRYIDFTGFGIVCRTQQQPKIEPNSVVSFTCENTGLVQTLTFCTVFIPTMHEYCTITPLRSNEVVYHNKKRQHCLTLSKNTITNYSLTSYLEGGSKFESKNYFHSYFTGCSGVLIIGKDSTVTATSLHFLLKGTFDKIKPPTSLEITNASSHLPDIICEYKCLQRLAITYNKHKILPKCLHKLTQLTILDAAYNALESIDEIIFGSEQQKTYLDLSFNKIKYIKKDAFSKLTNLNYLSLANNSLTELNFNLPESLMHLNLSHNNIKCISPSQIFHELHNIMNLILQYNEIKTINFSIPSSLLFLDLSHNCLKSIDLKMFQKAKCLETVRLDYNQITELKDNILHRSEEITILPKLKYMTISHNHLMVAPLTLIFLNKLQLLDFSHNKIEYCTWSDMRYEHILKNIDEKILHVGSGISEYNDEKDQEINENEILNLNHNRIRSLKDVFNSALIMSHRYATLFRKVGLAYNLFHCDCEMYPYLRALHDVSHSSSEIDDPTKNITYCRPFNWHIDALGLCHSPLKLKSHKVMDFEILDKLTCSILPKEKCKFIFKPSSPLLIVNCSNQKLEEMPDLNLYHDNTLEESLVFTLVKLRTKNHIPEGADTNILLNGNNFGKIHGHGNTSEKLALFFFIKIFANVRVRVVDLSHSNIVEIDDRFLFQFSENNPYLTHLYINDNNLTNLPLERQILYFEDEKRNVNHTVPFWKRLTEIHLYNNPWDCSCGTKWMKTWLVQLIVQKVLVRPDEIKCASPERNQNKIVYMLDEKIFCETPPSLVNMVYFSFLIGGIGLTALLGLILPFFFLYYRNANMTKTILEQVPPSRDNIVNDNDIRDMLYDAFVSYCEADSTWVEQELIPSIQQHDPPFKICEHKRHFVAGMTSQWNEFNAIRHSRRTIIVMSNSYLASEHCMYEFPAAYRFWIIAKNNPRLVVVKYQDIEIENHNETCTAYFRRFTYLVKDEHTFERLVEFMPRESLAQNAACADGVTASSFTQDEALDILLKSDKERTERTPESYEEELHGEDERYARLWQEAESEAAERTKAGEDIDPAELFVQKIDSIVKHPQ